MYHPSYYFVVVSLKKKKDDGKSNRELLNGAFKVLCTFVGNDLHEAPHHSENITHFVHGAGHKAGWE